MIWFSKNPDGDDGAYASYVEEDFETKALLC